MTVHRLLTPACLAALLAASSLAGCSSPKSPATGSDGSAPTAAATGPEAPRDAAEADKARELAEREQELARRETELAARESALAAKKTLPAASKPVTKPAAKPPAAKPVTADVARAPAASAASAASAAKASPLPPPPLVVPAGTPLSVALNNDITTKTARVGDPVDARVASAVVIDGRTAIPAGTRVRGTVSEVISGSDRIGGIPTLGLRFDGIELQPGRTVGISGNLHEQGRSDTARDTAKIAGGALVGAIIGKQIGDNKGRLLGGLLGGAAGVAAAKKTGTEVTLPAGTTFTVVLDQALNVP
jgi:hypothetical protein